MLFVPNFLRALAGLESGVIGGLLLLAWFIVDAVYQGQHWYAFPNLWSTAFFGNESFRMRASTATASGVALHLAQLGMAGSFFGLLWRKSNRFWLSVAAGIVWSLVWHWTMTMTFWRIWAPLVPRLMPQPATALAFFLFGVCLARTPSRAERMQAKATGAVTEITNAGISAERVPQDRGVNDSENGDGAGTADAIAQPPPLPIQALNPRPPRTDE